MHFSLRSSERSVPPLISHSNLRGFTLIELLVVLAIIALMVGIILPAFAKARASAHRIVSASNLAVLAQVHAGYSTDFNNSFVNPFNARTPQYYPGVVTATGPISYSTVILPSSTQSSNQPHALTLGASARSTEPFAHIWASFTSNYLHEIDTGLPVFRDPSDPYLGRKAEVQRSSGIPAENRVYDTSYWYPPVFWLKSDRYMTENFTPIGPAESESRWLAPNRLDHSPLPSMKVLLFERFDWMAMSDGSSGRSRGAQWNNPRAHPQVATVDGSVTSIDVARLSRDSASPPVDPALRPSGRYNPDAGYVYSWLYGPLAQVDTVEPYETGTLPSVATAAWPQFFYGTRDGVRGRDLLSRQP